jgi:hypothetical protein
MSILVPARAQAAMPVPAATTLAAATTVAAAGVSVGPAAVAVPAGILLAFALPGFALTAAAFRGRELSTAERVVLTPALSLALIVVSGLVLQAAGIGLDRGSWTATTAGVTVVALVMAASPVRARTGEPPSAEPGTPAPEPGTDDGPDADSGPRHPFGLRLLPLVVVALVLGGAGWFSFDDSRDNAARTVTAMSVVRERPAATAQRRIVTITITGLVAADAPYTLVTTGPGGRKVESRSVNADGGTWTGDLTVSGLDRISVNLFRAGRPAAAYRTVLLGPAS